MRYILTNKENNLDMARDDDIEKKKKKNHYLYITSKNLVKTTFFKVTLRLVVNWGGNMISLCSLFFWNILATKNA